MLNVHKIKLIVTIEENPMKPTLKIFPRSHWAKLFFFGEAHFLYFGPSLKHFNLHINSKKTN